MIYNVNFFENSHVTFCGNIVNGNLVVNSVSGEQWFALMEHYIHKQHERNRKMAELLSLLENASGEEKDNVLLSLRLL